jgi:hypothetical protein
MLRPTVRWVASTNEGSSVHASFVSGAYTHITPNLASSLAADDAAFEAAYPLALSGGVGVTEESLFPMMSASENLNAVGLLLENRGDRGDINAMPVMQLCRSAMESSARTIWILGHPDREVRRDRALNVLVEQLEQQKRFLKISEDNAANAPSPLPPDVAAVNQAHQSPR